MDLLATDNKNFSLQHENNFLSGNEFQDDLQEGIVTESNHDSATETSQDSALLEDAHSSPYILDRACSLDEDILVTPLEPVKSGLIIEHSVYDEVSSAASEELNLDDILSSEEAIAEAEIDSRASFTEHSNALSFTVSDEEDLCRQIDFNYISEENVHSCEESDSNVDSKEGKYYEESDGDISPDSILRHKLRGITPILRHDYNTYDLDETQSSDSFNRSHRVSFPDNMADMVTYMEPRNANWTISTVLSTNDILNVYRNSCKRNKTIEQDIIKNQIQDIKDNTNHSAILNLTNVITNEVNETLEDIFKICNFRTLILNDCKFTAATITEFLNMLEYYETVCEIEMKMVIDNDEMWKAFCSACSNLMVLESISFKGMNISEQNMMALVNTIKCNSNITVLRFDSCTLPMLPSFYLVENLMTNDNLCELYLPSSGLYTKEADSLGRFLSMNYTLKVLDISNNFIGDRGLEVLAKGLTTQNCLGFGLSVLIIFNNQITDKSGPTLNTIISECKNLHTINVGFNSLTDVVIDDIKGGLTVTKSLEGLGLQSTLLTCKGMEFLAASLEQNTSLQKINLKGNKAIQVQGLEALCNALTHSRIVKIEIDDSNRSCSDPDAYSQIAKKIIAICSVNKSLIESCTEPITSISKLLSRKVSLSCDPKLFDVSSLQKLSPLSSSSPNVLPVSSHSRNMKKNRFQVTKVADSKVKSNSRFKVTTVACFDEEKLCDNGDIVLNCGLSNNKT